MNARTNVKLNVRANDIFLKQKHNNFQSLFQSIVTFNFAIDLVRFEIIWKMIACFSINTFSFHIRSDMTTMTRMRAHNRMLHSNRVHQYLFDYILASRRNWPPHLSRISTTIIQINLWVLYTSVWKLNSNSLFVWRTRAECRIPMRFVCHCESVFNHTNLYNW